MNNPENRPSPEHFLAQARAAANTGDPARAGRGKLRIFFGFAAGVGKTYAMLEEAHRLQDQGRRIVIGYVEDHGRSETDLLLRGLEILPRRRLEHRGIDLSEFDIDAALTARPEICVVDELAHTNAPGMRHDKRYLDVLELLRNGIDVLTTVNVQHIESLADTVARITGITIRETVPDFLIDEADDVHLVDLPPHDLLRRLQEGRVYAADKARLAAERFFTNDNLIALRELAMRRIAERLGHDVRSARTRRGDRQVWGTRERLLVCVGPSPSSAQVIRTAARIARSLDAEWWAVTVQGPSALSAEAQTRLDRHLRLAERLGATVHLLTGASPTRALLDFAADRDITQIVVGRSRQQTSRRQPRTLVDELIQDSGSIDIHIIRDAESAASLPPPRHPLQVRWQSWQREWLTVGLVLTFLGLAAGGERLGLSLAVISLLLIAVVVALAIWRGRPMAGIAAAISAGLGYNFLFTEPRYTLWMEHTEDLVLVVVLILVGAGVGTLAGRVRAEASMARIAERRFASVAELTARFGGLSSSAAIAVAASAELARQWRRCSVLWLSNGTDGLRPIEAPWADRLPTTDRAAAEAAEWVSRNGREAGPGTDTLRERPAWMLPLVVDQTRLGVLAIQDAATLDAESRAVIQVQAGHIAQALERGRLAEDGQRTSLAAAQERQRATLLSSISHDLRTPLGVIQGASETLRDRLASTDDADLRSLAALVHEEATTLTSQVLNILDMTRLSSGSISAKRATVAVEELLESLLDRAAREWPHTRIEASLPEVGDVLLVDCDQLLVEQALINLIANAVRHAGPTADIRCAVQATPESIAIGILDNGPGLPADVEHLFAPFVRGETSGTPDARRGVGLGLAIAREIALLHEGSLEGSTRPEGGAAFWLCLPRVQETSHE
jgi:two-component system sensor histidine kinase KdpD